MNIQSLVAVPIVSCCTWTPFLPTGPLDTSVSQLNLFLNPALQTDSNGSLKQRIILRLRPFRNSIRHMRNDSTILRERNARHFRNRSSILREQPTTRDSWIQAGLRGESQRLTF